MSRLESKAKLLYYPTPSCIVDAIANYLTVAKRYGAIRLLDPCAGTGEALARLTGHLRDQLPTHHAVTLSTYGIEPELTRAKAASALLDAVLQASFFSTTLSNGNGPDGGWQCVFLYPPYDTDSEMTAASGKKTRLEVNFLYRATLKLCPGGILIWIVPQYSLSPAAKFLASHYDQLACLRFPDELYRPDPERPEEYSLYERFKQVVLFAQLRPVAVLPPAETIALIEQWSRAGHDLLALPLAEHCPDVPTYAIPAARSSELRLFAAGSYDPDHTASLVIEQSTKDGRYKTGVWANPDYLAARLPDPKAVGLGLGQPLAPLKNAHLALLSVAGIANRAVLTGCDGRRVIIKGYARKIPVLKQEENEEEIIERITDTFESSLWCLDLETGGLLRIETGVTSPIPFGVQYETMSLSHFLDNFGASLAEQVARANPPRYEGEHQLPWLGPSLQLLKRQPLGKQREIIAAIVNALINPSTALHQDLLLQRIALIAEMATGKTYLALASAFLADLYACGGISAALPGTRSSHIFPLVILCPPIMARKWNWEAEMTLPNVKAIIIKRIGSPAASGEKGLLEEGASEEGDSQITDDLLQIRQFDPDFTGTYLSAIGCLDRVVARIRHELEEWQVAYQQAVTQRKTPPPKPCHLIILTTSTAKLGMDWMPVYRLKVPRVWDPQTQQIKARRGADGRLFTIPCCPHCFRLLKNEQAVEQLKRTDTAWRLMLEEFEEKRTQGKLSVWEEEAALPPIIYFSEKELLGTKEHRVKRRCADCGEPLWQYVEKRPQDWTPYSILRLDQQAKKSLPLPAAGALPPCVRTTFRRRFPLGKYLQLRYKGFFHLLIADEVHEGRDGSALDFARQKLVNACGRKLGLTGTLSNGYSASLFRLFYILGSTVRHTFGYDEVERWIDLYGKRQTTKKIYKGEIGTGATSDRRIGNPQIREIAGFAPAGLAHVLPCSTFLELVDVAPALPPYEEETRLVEMDPDLEAAYEQFKAEATRELGRMLAVGDTSGLASWWNGMLHYPNMPYRGWTCVIKKTGEMFAQAPALPENRLYAKEQAVVSYVQREVVAGRRVLIYSENTGYYDILPRLKRLLEAKVRGRTGSPLKVALLYSTTVEPIDREAWLSKQVEAGCDVLICNPKLVKVGLDLLAFPTILYVSLPTSIADLRQSSRRSFRPGQTLPVKVVFFVYPTMEMDLLRLMALKMKASLMVEGKLQGEGLVSFGEEEAESETEMILHLAREIMVNMREGKPSSGDVRQQAQELQDLFKENGQIEREKNQLLGQTTASEVVDFKPIVVESLPAGDLLPAEPDQCEAASTETLVEGGFTVHSEQEPLTAVVQLAQVPTQTVTIIQTAVTSGRDPWAALREQYGKPKRRRKRPQTLPDTPDLWSFAASSPSAS